MSTLNNLFIASLLGNQIGNNMCGQFLPSPITIHGSQEVRVTFRSDSTVQFEGFAIRVTFGRPITEGNYLHVM